MAKNDPRKLIDSLTKSFSNLKKVTESFKNNSFNKSFSEGTKGLKEYIILLNKLGHAANEDADRMKKFNKAMRRTFNNSVLGQAAAFFKLQSTWYPVKALTFATLGIPKDVVKSYADFSDALLEVRSVGQLTDSQMQDLSKTMMDIGISTKFSAVEVAKAAKSLAQAGFRGKELQAALSPATNLSTATNADMKVGTDIMSTVVRAYQMSSTQFKEISDVLTNAVVNSKLNLQDLATSFSYVSSAAAQTGVSFKETVTLLGILANSGLKASTAATGLRMALLKIVAPTRKAKKVLKRLGLTKEDLDIANKGIKEVLRTISALDTTDVIEIFGARSANAVLALKNVSIEAISALEQLIGQTGTASAIANEQMLSLTKSWKNLLDNLTEIKIKFGETFGEALAVRLRATSSLIQDIANNFSKLVPYLKTAAVIFAGLKINKMFGGIIKENLIGSIKGISAAFLDFSSDMKAWLGQGASAAVAFKESIISSFGLASVAVRQFMVALAPFAIAGAIFYGIKLINDYFEQTYVDAEKLKTNVVKAQAALARMVGDAKSLVISFGRLSKLDLSSTIKDLIIGRGKQKYIKDTESLFGNYIKAAEKGSDYLKRRLKQLRDEAIEAIKQANNPKEIVKVQKEISRKLDTFLNEGYGKEFSSYEKSMLMGLSNDPEVLAQIKKQREKDAKKQVEIEKEALIKAYTNPTLAAEVSKARSFLYKGSITISEPTDLSSLKLVKQARNQVKKTIKQLEEILSSPDISNEYKNQLRDDLAALNVRDVYLESLITSFELGPDAFSKLKIKVLQGSKAFITTAINAYKASFKVLGKSKANKEGKNLLRDLIFEKFFSKYGDKETLTPELNNLYQNLSKQAEKQFDRMINLESDQKRLKVIKAQIEATKSLVKNLKVQKKGYSEQSAVLDKLIKEKAELEKKIALASGQDPKIATYKEQKAQLDKETKAILDRQKKEKGKNNPKIKSIKEQISYYRELADTLTKTRDYNVEYSGNKTIIEDLNSQILDARKNVIEFRKELINLTIKNPELKAAKLKLLDLEGKNLTQVLKKSEEDLNNFYDSVKTAFTDPITHMFDNVIEGTESVSEAFRNMAEDILKSMAKVFVNRMMENAANGLFNMLFESDNGTTSTGYQAVGYKRANPWVQTLITSVVKGIANWGVDKINFNAPNTSGTPTQHFGAFDNPNKYSGTFGPTKINIVNNGTPATVTDVSFEKGVANVVLADLYNNGQISQTLNTRTT